MSQIWKRIKRLAQSYMYDSPLYSYESLEEEDQRRLKEIIDQLNQKPPASQQSRGQGEAGGQAGRDSRQQSRSSGPSRPQGPTIESALAVLGLPANVSDEEIKKAYKRLMLKYHPDRVASLSATEQEAAHRRARELNVAYQFIKQHRKL